MPSRWLNRLMNLMAGLPAAAGAGGAGGDAGARARSGLRLAQAIDRPEATVPPAHRARRRARRSRCGPKELAVTGIRTLIRDPYAIYARHVLQAAPAGPAARPSRTRWRGDRCCTVSLKRSSGAAAGETDDAAMPGFWLSPTRFWPRTRPGPRRGCSGGRGWSGRRTRFWRARRRVAASRCSSSRRAAWTLPGLDFRLTAKPDRIDELPDGRLHILDYKTGAPPTAKQQKAFRQAAAAGGGDGGTRGLRALGAARGGADHLCRA